MNTFAAVDRSVSPPRVDVPREYNAALDFVDRHLGEGRAAKVAFVDDHRALTYGDLAEAVNRAGNALLALGTEPEQRALLVMLDSVDVPTVFFGAIKAGIVPVPVNTQLTTRDYDFMLRDSRAKVLVVSGALYEKLEEVLVGQPYLEHVIVTGGTVRPGAHALDALLAAAPATLEAAETSRDDTCFWLYTSGSTGQPKAAMHTHSHLVYTAEYYGIAILGIDEGDTVFSAAKLFFAYGLGNAMTFPLRVGATAVLLAERATPRAVIETLVARRPTIFGGVPTLYASLLADPSLPQPDRTALRRCLSAGEALPEEVGRTWRERMGVDILDGIGSTEMLHIFLSNRPGEVVYGTTGRAVPGYALKLVGDAGVEVGPGEAGDLWVSGPSAATCYWNRRDLSLATFHGPWSRTGDRYALRDDGFYVYQGRSDDMLKVGGVYVSPFEVEGALVAHAAVLEAAVVGCEDENGLVKPKAYVVLKAHVAFYEGLADELKAHVKAKLAPYKYPRWVEFTAELPKTATGKIQRFRLRGRLRSWPCFA